MDDKQVEQELKRQLQILQFGTVEITPEHEFVAMLKESIKSGVPLRIKAGIDPTSSNVHLGHLVPFRKMRQFQDLGHIGVVIIGDYTACIGDPSGKDTTRSALTAEMVKKNAETYMDQVFTVLDPQKTEITYQTEWFEEVDLRDVIGWAQETTVAKLLSHDTFSRRLEGGGTLALHELFYPVLQGMDSVFVKADVELGGTDQKFNVMMGRDYQKHRNMRPQVAMLLPIVMGLCGTQKMSKSLGNYIGIHDEPFDKFGKIMSIPDTLMIDYFKYIASATPEEVMEIEQGLKEGRLHPNEVKKLLAKKTVALFHGEELGSQMKDQFEQVFKKGDIPDDTPSFEFKRGDSLLNVLVASELFATNSEIRRLFQQGAISLVQGDKISDEKMVLTDEYTNRVLKIGKRKFLRLI